MFDFSNYLIAQEAPNSGFAGFVDKAARTPQGTIVAWVFAFTICRVVIYFLTKNVPLHRRVGAVFTLYKFVNELFDAVIYAGVFVFLLVRPYLIQAFRVPSGSMVSTLMINDFIIANKFVYRYSDPKAGDVVVFVPPKPGRQPSEMDSDGNVDVDYVKRCMGVPGDIIEIKNDNVYRNGIKLNEPYKHFESSDPTQTIFTEESQTASEENDAHPTDFKFVNYNGSVIPINMRGDMLVNDTNFVAKEFRIYSPSEIQKIMSLPPAPIPKGMYFFMGDDRNNSFDARSWGLTPRENIVGRADYIWLPVSRISRVLSQNGLPASK